ncbi:kinase-like domain-containing protein [Mycena olivaceomarginata]|nr:kinase-like domain-containing protein [Mycena olivaceomarginata]KAJ7881588.1 kinase-like domain-containing protein [Mycena olivaceomarginata]
MKGSPTATTLGDRERFWANHQPFLESCGYMLRRRYRPGWIPDVLAGKSVLHCEDSLGTSAQVLDATRISDGAPVVLKIVATFSPDTRTSWFLTNEPGAEHHAVPCLELIPFSVSEDLAFMVMPRMRECCDPPWFATVREFVEFAQQVLEGLVYLHSKNIAHRDICTRNIVVDPSTMIPGGSHFLVPWRASDGITCLTHFEEGHTDKPYMKSRTQAGPLKYYFIDFGLSVQFRSFEERELVIGEFGRLRKDIPEISGTVPYDPFKVDVRLVGEMMLHEFLRLYDGLNIIIPFVRKLRREDPARRPDAAAALELFKALISKMTDKELDRPIRRAWRSWEGSRQNIVLFLRGLGLSCG